MTQLLQLQPTPDPDSPTGVLIPRTLDAAMDELDRLLPPALKTELAQASIPDRLPLETLARLSSWCVAAACRFLS